MKGFSLLELLVVVAIIGIISAVGIVSYNGYIANVKNKQAQTGLQSIYLEQEEYKSINKQYYRPSGGCGDQTDTINNGLFDGKVTLDNTDFRFCITGNQSSYSARATNKINGSYWFQITNNNQKRDQNNNKW